MDYNKIIQYGWRCQMAKYNHIENDGDYAIQREGNIVYLLFEWTDDSADWKYNLDFPIKPYKDMGVTWRCHRGFLRAWKNIEPYVKEVILDTSVEKIIVVGYSHGAAIAAFAHEYVWFNRPDLRENGLEGYGFGSPRVYWGWRVKQSLRERWANYYVITNKNDIVTKVPPLVFGYCHVGNVIKVDSGERRPISAHMWTEYVKGLKEIQQNGKDA
jgi:hypothetical protein